MILWVAIYPIIEEDKRNTTVISVSPNKIERLNEKILETPCFHRLDISVPSESDGPTLLPQHTSSTSGNSVYELARVYIQSPSPNCVPLSLVKPCF